MLSNRFAWTLVVLLSAVTACTPSLSPLYRDFAFQDEQLDAAKTQHIRVALAEAGWVLAVSTLPNVIVTEPKGFGNWGLYKTNLYLEVVGVGDKYARVFFHPYRKYITGGRGKIPYLSSGLQAAVIPALKEAFEKQGLVFVGATAERERLIVN